MGMTAPFVLSASQPQGTWFLSLRKLISRIACALHHGLFLGCAAFSRWIVMRHGPSQQPTPSSQLHTLRLANCTVLEYICGGQTMSLSILWKNFKVLCVYCCCCWTLKCKRTCQNVQLYNTAPFTNNRLCGAYSLLCVFQALWAHILWEMHQEMAPAEQNLPPVQEEVWLQWLCWGTILGTGRDSTGGSQNEANFNREKNGLASEVPPNPQLLVALTTSCLC